VTRCVSMLSLALLLGLACAGPPPPSGSQELEAAAAPVPAPAPAPAPAPRIAAPELRYRRGPAGVEYSRWTELDALYLGVDLANLRASPSPEAPVVATLPMGAPLVVLAPSSEQETVLERTNRWYRVRSGQSEGHVFGSLLTPLVLQADLDGDQGAEWVSVTFGPDFVPRVRVMEPDLSVEDDRMVGLDLKMPGLAQGGTVTATVRASPDDDWQLLEVQLCEEGRCARKLVSYLRQPGQALGQLAEIPGDPDKLEFVTGGLSFGGPTLWPAGGRFGAAPQQEEEGQVTWEPGSPELVATLTLEEVQRGPSSTAPCSALGTLTSGTHKGKALLSCVISQGGKGGPDERYLIRFVRDSSESWIFLPRLSYSGSWLYDLLQPAIEAQGISLGTDWTTTVRGLEMPQVLLEGPWGRLRLEYHADEAWTASGSSLLSVHPRYGTVYGRRDGEGAVYLPQPEGNYVVYNFELGSWLQAETGATRYQVRTGHCGEGESLYARVVEATDKQLAPYGSSMPERQLFALVDPEHPFHAERHAEYTARLSDAPELAEFLAGLPYLLWRDPFGRLVEVLRSDLQPPNLCEPVLYLYGTDEPVTVTLGPDIFVTASAPRVQDHRWTLLPTGDGGVSVPGSDERWPFLFWEGQSGLFEPPAGGEVVARAEVRAHLRRVLAARGLQGREIDDFLEAWAPELEQSPFVRISFHEPGDIDELVPMTIEPPPDTLVRVMMEYEPLQRAPRERPPATAPRAILPRQGFTVVEWGGVRR
jgi:hypothetical protein